MTTSATKKTTVKKKVATKKAVTKKVATTKAATKKVTTKKAPPKKVSKKVSTKKTAPKKATKNVSSAKPKKSVISNEEKRMMVAMQAYYKWEKAGFPGGQDWHHWLEAENEVEEMFK